MPRLLLDTHVFLWWGNDASNLTKAAHRSISNTSNECYLQETKDIFLMMGWQEETYSDVVPLRGGYRPKRLKSRQLYILQGLPQVGPTVSRRLLDHFGSVSKMMQAPIEELMRVEGIGKDSAKKIRDVLDAV